MEFVSVIITILLIVGGFYKLIEATKDSIFVRFVGVILFVTLSLGMSSLGFLYRLLGYTRDVHGSARFMTFFEKLSLISSSNNGLVVDGKKKLSLENSYIHLLLCAPTGAGKSTTYIVPNIVSQAKYGYSMVVTDPSGELHKLTSGYLKKKGYDVKVLDITDPQNSARYNPLYRANTLNEIAKVTDIIVDNAIQRTGTSDPFWSESAKVIINLSIRALKKKAPKYQNLYNLNNILIQIGGSKKQREKIDKMMARDLDRVSFEAYMAFISQAPNTFQSCMSSAKMALSKVANDQNLAEITLSETLNFETLRQKPTALFLVIPEHEMKFYSFLSSLLYTQIFNYAMLPKTKGQPYLPIFFLLDEFANTGRIPGIDTIISTIRKKDCSLSLVVQDLAQLYEKYGSHVASTIMSNCLSHIYYPGLSLNTCRMLEQTLGVATVKHREMGYKKIGGLFSSDRSRSMPRKLLTADEIRTLPKGQALMLHANKHPVMLDTTPWYENWRIKVRLGQ